MATRTTRRAEQGGRNHGPLKTRVTFCQQAQVPGPAWKKATVSEGGEGVLVGQLENKDLSVTLTVFSQVSVS